MYADTCPDRLASKVRHRVTGEGPFWYSAGMHSIDTPDVAALPTVWTFFYGSYMNLDVLKEVDLVPGRVEVARLNGFDILIRPLANLVRSDQP